MTRPDLLTAATATCYTLALAGLIWLTVFFALTPARSAPPAPDGLAADRTVDRTSRSAARTTPPTPPKAGSFSHPGSPRPRLNFTQPGTSGEPAEPVNAGKRTGSAGLGWPWRELAQCESGRNPRAVNPAGPYYGLFQFLASTWQSVGGHGLPTEASPTEQLHRARILQARFGWGQWPYCSAKLGLR